MFNIYFILGSIIGGIVGGVAGLLLIRYIKKIIFYFKIRSKVCDVYIDGPVPDHPQKCAVCCEMDIDGEFNTVSFKGIPIFYLCPEHGHGKDLEIETST